MCIRDRGHSAPSRETREEVAGTIAASSFTGGANQYSGFNGEPVVAGALDTQCGGGKLTHQSANNGHLILEKDLMGTLTARMFASLGARDVEEGALHPVAFDAYNQEVTGAVSKTVAARSDQDTASCIAFSSNMSTPDCRTDGTTPTVKLGGHGGGNPPAVVYDTKNITSPTNGSNPQPGDPVFTLASGQHLSLIHISEPTRPY